MLFAFRACGLGLLEIVKRTQEKATFSAQDLQAYTVRWWSYVVGFFPLTQIPPMQRFRLGSNVCKQRNGFRPVFSSSNPVQKAKV
ncbi:hypothetical protein NC651_013632 [Populus alba x Populus x berolinensis]|nr:hypothetical protein NC651_013632 [Populus alba x Populus x berolinensis]